MKKLLPLVVLFALAYTTSMFASDIQPVKIIAKAKMVKDDVMKITLANLQRNDTSIEVTDLDKEAMYYRSTIKKRNGYSLKLDLQKLPVGRYLITVRNSGETLKQVIHVKKDMILLSKFS